MILNPSSSALTAPLGATVFFSSFFSSFFSALAAAFFSSFFSSFATTLSVCLFIAKRAICRGTTGRSDTALLRDVRLVGMTLGMQPVIEIIARAVDMLCDVCDNSEAK
eukprot:5321293-Pyramimonas_sp.AAC.1